MFAYGRLNVRKNGNGGYLFRLGHKQTDKRCVRLHCCKRWKTAWTDDPERLKTLLVGLNGSFRPYRHNTYIIVCPKIAPILGPVHNECIYMKAQIVDSRVSHSFLLFSLSPLAIQRSAAAARSGVRASTITALPCPAPRRWNPLLQVAVCSCTSWAEGNPSVNAQHNGGGTCTVFSGLLLFFKLRRHPFSGLASLQVEVLLFFQMYMYSVSPSLPPCLHLNRFKYIG
jgi:hypothetical protein